MGIICKFTPDIEIASFNITAPPKQLSREEEVLHMGESCLITFGKFFLLGDFRKTENPSFHYEIGDAYLDTSTTQQLACIVSRSHGKTTLTKAYIIHSICYRKKDDPPRFIGWVSDTIAKCFSNLHYVANNLEFNKRIRRYFGKRGGKGLSRVWNKQEITTVGEDFIVSRSNVKSIRGETISSLVSGTLRYFRVILDDIENEANTKTFDSRDWIKKNAINAVYPALDPNIGRLIFNGTPVHPDSLCQQILDNYIQAVNDGRGTDFSWMVMYYPATQPTMPGGVLWNSYMPREKLDERKQFFIDTYGDDTGYYQEYELQPQGMADKIWTPDHYQLHTASYFWDEDLKHSFLNWGGSVFPVNCFIGGDPATDIETMSSDFNAITAIAVDVHFRIFALEYICKRSVPQLGLRDSKTGELLGKKGYVDYFIELYDTYHCLGGGLEDVGMTRGIWQDLEAEKFRLRKQYIFVEPEKPGGKEKKNKIRTGLNKHFARKQVFVRKEHYELKKQIEGFGIRLTHEDLIESFYFAVKNAYAPTRTFQRKQDVINETYDEEPRRSRSWIVR